MSQRIQFLRTKPYSTKAEANTALLTEIGKREYAAEPITAFYKYKEGEVEKVGIIFAISVGDKKNYTIYESSASVPESVSKAIADAIAVLDAATVGETGKMIQSIYEKNGVIHATAVEASAANISNATITEQDDTIGITSTTVQASIAELAKAIKTAEKSASSTVTSLKVDDTVKMGKYVSAVSQTGGKITVSREDLPVTSVTDEKTNNQFVTNIKLDGTVVKAEKSGITASQVTRSKGTNVTSTTVEEAIEEVGKAVADATTAGKVTISTTTTTEGYLKSYTIYQGDTDDIKNKIGTIDIPKDLVVTSGSVVYGTWSVDKKFTENGESGTGTGTALKLVIANQTDPVYINTNSLVDIYTAGTAITVDANKISVQLAKTQDGNAALDSTNGLKVAAVKISSGYGDSVTYPTVSGATFMPVAKEQTLDAALRNVDGNVATLANQVVANEKVTAEALTSLKNAAGFDDNGNYSAVTDATYIANATSVKDATSKLDAAIKTVADKEVVITAGEGINVTSTEGSTTKTIAVATDNSSIKYDSTTKYLYVGVIDCGEY